MRFYAIGGLVSVALIRPSLLGTETGVTHYAALWSPDFPPVRHSYDGRTIIRSTPLEVLNKVEADALRRLTSNGVYLTNTISQNGEFVNLLGLFPYLPIYLLSYFSFGQYILYLLSGSSLNSPAPLGKNFLRFCLSPDTHQPSVLPVTRSRNIWLGSLPPDSWPAKGP